MARWAWLTPDDESGDVCRSFRIPVPILPALMGALDQLCHEQNWEAFGDLTPEACTLLARETIDSAEDGCMIGKVEIYATGTLPDYVLECDGAVYNRVDYPLLYAAIDVAYHIDADTFRVPDMVNRVPMGTTDDTGGEGGEATHVLTVDEMPNHAHADAGHSHTDLGHTHGEGIAIPAIINGGLEAPAPASIPGASITAIGWANIQGSAADIQASGGGGAHNNLPPYHKLRFGIRWR